MNLIDFGFDSSIKVLGVMRDTMEAKYLCEDMLEIDLPGGLTIGIGWEPHCDPSGAFHIALFRKYSTENVIAPIITNEIQTAVSEIKRLAVEYRWLCFNLKP